MAALQLQLLGAQAKGVCAQKVGWVEGQGACAEGVTGAGQGCVRTEGIGGRQGVGESGGSNGVGGVEGGVLEGVRG